MNHLADLVKILSTQTTPGQDLNAKYRILQGKRVDKVFLIRHLKKYVEAQTHMTNATKTAVIRMLGILGLLGMGVIAMFSDVIDLEEIFENGLSAPAETKSLTKKAANGKF